MTVEARELAGDQDLAIRLHLHIAHGDPGPLWPDTNVERGVVRPVRVHPGDPVLCREAEVHEVTDDQDLPIGLKRHPPNRGIGTGERGKAVIQGAITLQACDPLPLDIVVLGEVTGDQDPSVRLNQHIAHPCTGAVPERAAHVSGIEA